MTSSESKAIAAIDTLVNERDAAKGRVIFFQAEAEKAQRERDAAKRHATNAEARALAAEKRVLDLEDRTYGRTARSLTGFFECAREYVPALMADHIRIQPRSTNLMLPRTDVFSAQQPLTVISEAIKRIVEMHSREIEENLRRAMWPQR